MAFNNCSDCGTEISSSGDKLNDKDVVEYSCKIVQGIVSNPSVKVLFKRDSLFLQFGEDDETNIATIFDCVKKGVINGINAQK